MIFDYISPPQYHLPALSRYFRGELRGPDSGISAIIPADKYASLQQAKDAESKQKAVCSRQKKVK